VTCRSSAQRLCRELDRERRERRLCGGVGAADVKAREVLEVEHEVRVLVIVADGDKCRVGRLAGVGSEGHGPRFPRIDLCRCVGVACRELPDEPIGGAGPGFGQVGGAIEVQLDELAALQACDAHAWQRESAFAVPPREAAQRAVDLAAPERVLDGAEVAFERAGGSVRPGYDDGLAGRTALVHAAALHGDERDEPGGEQPADAGHRADVYGFVDVVDDLGHGAGRRVERRRAAGRDDGC
jgi:hypothetical protein